MNGVAWGGSEELWSRTALHLRELGHDVQASLFAWPSRPDPVLRLERAGVRTSFRPLNRNALDRLLSRLFRRWYPGSLDFREVRWLSRAAPDLVIVSQGGPWDGVPWMSTCGRLGIRYCGVVQANSEIWWPIDEDLPTIRATVQGAQRLFFVSQSNRELMERQVGLRLEAADVVANPVNLHARQAVPWPQNTDGIQLACVARLEPRAKGQDVLFQVLSQPKWRQRPLQVNLYGSGSGEQSLRSLASLLDLSNVRFHGQVSDVDRIWAANHALVLPSRYEGLPLVIVEAMLCGRPIIATDVAGNAELARDGVEGFFAAAPTVSLVDDALERAWARRDQWQEMGRRARAQALRVTPENPIEDFTGMLLRIVDSGYSRPALGRPSSTAKTRAVP
ncbi:MAG: glycosyltransferase family 4 protein [Verrucomicrobiota bacterium]